MGNGSEEPANEPIEHVVVLASRFSLETPPCGSWEPPATPRPGVQAEVVCINRLFTGRGVDRSARRETFLRKYDKVREMEVDVRKLSGDSVPASPEKPSRSNSRSRRNSSLPRRVSQTVSFDSHGRVCREEFYQTDTFSEESSVFDDNEDPLESFFDFPKRNDLLETQSEKACQTFFKAISSETQTFSSQSPDLDRTTLSSSGSDYGKQTQNDLNKMPNIVVTPPKQFNNLVKPSSLYAKHQGDPLGATQISTAGKLKGVIDNLHSKNVGKAPGEEDKTLPSEADDKKLNSAFENLRSSNLRSSNLSDTPDNLSSTSTKDLKSVFERGLGRNDIGRGKGDKGKSAPGSVKSHVSSLEVPNEEPLLERLLGELGKLTQYKLAEFERRFVCKMTDRELLEIVRFRFRERRAQALVDIIKQLCQSTEADDIFEIFEEFVNVRPYNECKRVTMRICENFLNKKDLSEFLMRNYRSLSEPQMRAMAATLLQDLPYDSMKQVLESGLARLKEKDIPHVLNSIQTEPHGRELEKAVSILSSKLSSKDTQKLVRDLGRGMREEEVRKTIKQLSDYLPHKEGEGLASRFMERHIDGSTQTEISGLKQTESKCVGTDPPKEKRGSIKARVGDLLNQKNLVNRAVQTDAVNRLLFKEKSDLQNVSQAIDNAKRRFLDKVGRTRTNKEDIMLGLHSSPTPSTISTLSSILCPSPTPSECGSPFPSTGTGR